MVSLVLQLVEYGWNKWSVWGVELEIILHLPITIKNLLLNICYIYLLLLYLALRHHINLPMDPSGAVNLYQTKTAIVTAFIATLMSNSHVSAGLEGKGMWSPSRVVGMMYGDQSKNNNNKIK
jgi:hypothetical protein